MECIGERIRRLREHIKMTQSDLAKLLGVGKTTVSNYETSYSNPDFETLNKLADIFNVSVDYLLGRESKIETKACHNVDLSGLPEDAIRQVEEYIELIKLKYNPDGSLKKK